MDSLNSKRSPPSPELSMYLSQNEKAYHKFSEIHYDENRKKELFDIYASTFSSARDFSTRVRQELVNRKDSDVDVSDIEVDDWTKDKFSYYNGDDTPDEFEIGETIVESINLEEISEDNDNEVFQNINIENEEHVLPQNSNST